MVQVVIVDEVGMTALTTTEGEFMRFTAALRCGRPFATLRGKDDGGDSRSPTFSARHIRLFESFPIKEG